MRTLIHGTEATVIRLTRPREPRSVASLPALPPNLAFRMAESASKIPKISLQSPAVDFIDNRLPKYHPVFADHQVQYNPAANRYVPVGTFEMTQAAPLPPPTQVRPGGFNRTRPEPSAEIDSMGFWNDIFGDSMLKFSQTYPSTSPSMPKPNPSQHRPWGTSRDHHSQEKERKYYIRDKKDWAGVYGQLKDAQNHYTSEEGPKGLSKKLYRGLGRNVQPARQVLAVISEIEYIKPVIGAVSIILEACEIASETSKEILSGFDDLLHTLSEIETLMATFVGDKNVRGAAVDLLVATFNAIELAIGFFAKHTIMRGAAAIFKPKTYGSELRKSLGEIESSSERLRNEAYKSDMYESKVAREEDRKESYESKTAIGSVKALLEDHIVAVDRAIEEQKRHAEEQKRHAEEQQRHAEQQQRYTEQQQRQIDYLSYLVIDLQSRAPSPAPAAEQFNKDMLWRLLDIPDLQKEDVEHISARKGQLKQVDRSRAEQLVNNHEFKKWVVSPASTRLLVHGDSGTPIPRISALSLLCCTLIEAFQVQGRFVSLVFFCGSHLDDDDPYTGGRTMIKSLISQLILQHEFDLTMVRDHVEPDLIRLGDIDQLCCLFVCLVRQLPRDKTLFCLIDGIVFYEREGFVEDMAEVLACILQITADRSMGAAVKLLLTSPTNTIEARKGFPDDAILSMSSLQTSTAGPSDLRFWRQLSESNEECRIEGN